MLGLQESGKRLEKIKQKDFQLIFGRLIFQKKLKFLLQNGGSVIIYLMPEQIDKNLGQMGAFRLNNSSPKVFERLNLPSFKDQTDPFTPGYTSGQRNKLDDKIRNLK